MVCCVQYKARFTQSGLVPAIEQVQLSKCALTIGGSVESYCAISKKFDTMIMSCTIQTVLCNKETQYFMKPATVTEL